MILVINFLANCLLIQLFSIKLLNTSDGGKKKILAKHS